MLSQQRVNTFSTGGFIVLFQKFFQKRCSFDSGTEKSVCLRFQEFRVFQKIRCDRPGANCFTGIS